MTFLLALDQSTSATKAVLYDSQFNVLDKCVRTHAQSFPRPGWVEQDANEIWKNVLAVSRELLERQSERRDNVVALAITNQRETVVVFDKQSGKPLHPAIVWQCRRGDALCAEQIELGRHEVVRARTGLRIDGYFSGSKLQWLMRERPELARKIALGTALVGTIDAYLIYRLTGGAVFATDHTNASRTLLFDIRKLNWDAELCAWWQVPRHALPEPRASDAQFGHTTLGGALLRAVPICGVMGDSQSALFAHRCFDPGNAKVTFGSGSSVLLNVGSRLQRATNAVTSLAWVRGNAATYALEGMINSCASTLTWLSDQVGIFANAQEAEQLAGGAELNQGVYLVPAFGGLGAPHWRQDARAAIVGLTAHSDRRHIARAALESMAYQVRDILDMLHAESGVQVTELRCDGGPTASELLMQFTADLLGVELRVPRDPDCSALGVATMAALGMGIHPDTAALTSLPREERIYRRKMTAEQAGARYQGWKQALQQVLCVA